MFWLDGSDFNRYSYITITLFTLPFIIIFICYIKSYFICVFLCAYNDKGNNLTVEGMTFTNCTIAILVSGTNNHLIANSSFYSNGNALRLTSESLVNIDHCFFFNHSLPTIEGRGAITLTVSFSLFERNIYTVGGGSCISGYGTIISRNNRYISNYANTGGALQISSSTCTLDSDYYYNNSALNSYGTLYFGVQSIVRNCIFESNKGYHGGVGSISSGANVTMYNCTFLNNLSENVGGVFEINGGTLRVEKSRFIGNRARDGAVATITFNTGTHQFIDCEFIGNKATQFGGVLYLRQSARASISSSILDSNIGPQGCAVYVSQGVFNITDSLVANHYYSIGVIYYSISEVTSYISGCTFQNNTISQSGYGVVMSVQAPVSVSGSTFTSNTGEVFRVNIFASLFLFNTAFSKNKNTDATGSVIYVYYSSIVEISSCTITDSEAALSINFNTNTSFVINNLRMDNNQGPIKVGLGGSLNLSSSSFTGNRGGVISVDRGSANITNIQCLGNRGAIGGCLNVMTSSSATIGSSNISNNVATAYGGGIAIQGTVVVRNVEMSNNTAIRGGGIWVGTSNANAVLDLVSVHHSKAEYGGGIQLESYARGTIHVFLLLLFVRINGRM